MIVMKKYVKKSGPKISNAITSKIIKQKINIMKLIIFNLIIYIKSNILCLFNFYKLNAIVRITIQTFFI